MIEYNRVELGKAAKERGFVRDTFEKVLRLKEILRLVKRFLQPGKKKERCI